MHHTTSPALESMLDAVLAGTRAEGIEGVDVVVALGVTVDFFYQGLGDLRETPAAPSRDRICLEVMRSFGMIKNERHQEALNQLVRALADREG